MLSRKFYESFQNNLFMEYHIKDYAWLDIVKNKLAGGNI